MTSQDLKQLEDTLWQSADTLRASSDLKSTEYSTPVLGLIFLKFADNKYSRYEQEILVEHQKLQGTRREKPISEIALEKCGFYLAEGQGGGEFFTPRSVVRLLKVLDNKVRRLEKHHDISKATKPVKAELEQLHQELKDAEYFFTHIIIH